MGTDTPLVGASTWEQDLFDHLTGHITTEREILEEYQHLSEDSSLSPAFRYLAGIILADEIRHHRIFAELAASVRADSELRDNDDAIPSVAGLTADHDRIIGITDRLLTVEQDDARELEGLARKLRDLRETSLWPLLVDLMLDDTSKHIKILRFLRDRARSRRL